MSPVGGTTHQYVGEGLGQILSWTCPACGTLQTMPFGEPCATCGAGARPFVAATTPTTHPKPIVLTPTDPPVFLPPAPFPTGAFDLWLESYLARALPTEIDTVRGVQALLADAFEAGWRMRGRATEGEMLTAASTPPVTFAVEGRTARTLAAALAMFIDQVLTDAGAEIAAGEWLSVDEAKTLVAQYTREGAQ